MAGLEEFQRAILLTFDPGADPAQRREANASLDALKQAAEGWRFCFQAFGASDVPQVKFWCLQTLVSLVSERSGERYVALPEPQKAELRANLIAWVQVRGDSHTTGPLTTQPTQQRPCLPQLSTHALLTHTPPMRAPPRLFFLLPLPRHRTHVPSAPDPEPPRARAQRSLPRPAPPSRPVGTVSFTHPCHAPRSRAHAPRAGQGCDAGRRAWFS